MCVVLLGSNSPKMSVFYMNSDKKCVMFRIIFLKMSGLSDMTNSEKKFVALLCINSLKVLEMFDMKSKKKCVVLFGVYNSLKEP